MWYGKTRDDRSLGGKNPSKKLDSISMGSSPSMSEQHMDFFCLLALEGVIGGKQKKSTTQVFYILARAYEKGVSVKSPNECDKNKYKF